MIKITIPTSLLSPTLLGGSPDDILVSLASYAKIGGAESSMSQSGDTVSFKIRSQFVPLDLAKLVVSKGGDVDGSLFFVAIPDIDSALPDILEPRTIIEYTEDPDTGESQESGSHLETWRERDKSWNCGGLHEQEDGSGYWPLLIGHQPKLERSAITMAQAISSGFEIVDVLPTVPE